MGTAGAGAYVAEAPFGILSEQRLAAAETNSLAAGLLSIRYAQTLIR